MEIRSRLGRFFAGLNTNGRGATIPVFVAKPFLAHVLGGIHSCRSSPSAASGLELSLGCAHCRHLVRSHVRSGDEKTRAIRDRWRGRWDLLLLVLVVASIPPLDFAC